ncbi:hypothetical protein IPM62_01600 [Candidatus Woesebacteria bacterium]|nr:MAG: hypothetical protein IPM62_01600 [Candidatus Woesebacteria bacterium]
MYFPQTSLLPATITIANFVKSHGLEAFGMWYKNWYLGVPFRNIADPLLPIITVGIQKLISYFTISDITIYIIILAYIGSIIGWVMFTYYISKNKLLPVLVFLFLVLLPWRIFSTIYFMDGASSVAKSFIPLVFLSVWFALSKKGMQHIVFSLISLITILLISTSIIPGLLVGLISLSAVSAYKKGKLVNLKTNIVFVVKLLIVSLVIVTLWYKPLYWITLLSNPSLGGNSFVKVIAGIFSLTKSILPATLAVFMVHHAKRVRNRLTIFFLIWIAAFSILFSYRFFADYDFWQDWSGWIYEIEIGIAGLCAIILNSIITDIRKGGRISGIGKIVLTVVLLALIPYALVWRFNSALASGLSSKQGLNINNFSKELNTQIPSRVFVSGTNTFVLNTLIDMEQVRGGKDQAATHPYWNHAAYQLREGSDPELSRLWLQALGVSFVIVNTGESDDFYKDFKYLHKWEKIGNLVREGNGDKLYFIKDADIAWSINPQKTIKPERDNYEIALREYLLQRIEPLVVTDLDNGYAIQVHTGTKAVQLAVSYNKAWEIDGKVKCKVVKDSLGQMAIVFDSPTDKMEEVRLVYGK